MITIDYTSVTANTGGDIFGDVLGDIPGTILVVGASGTAVLL